MTKLTGWRRLASAIWDAPRDPQVYGELDVDATALLAFVEDVRRRTGAHVTVTHVVGRAIALALAEHPDVNAFLSRGRIVRRDSADIFFVVALEGGRDLSGVKVEHADRKTVAEIAKELTSRAGRMRSGDDELARTKRLIDATPRPLLRPALGLADRLTVDRNLDLPRLGLRRQSFGSAMVSSVASFGVQRAFTPLSPYYRVPLVAVVGEVTPKPVVVDGIVVARPVLTVTATLDHRYLDGAHAGRLASSVRAYLAAPTD